MKHFLIALGLATCLLTACNGSQGHGEGLSTDLVNNPKSASTSNNKEAVISFDKMEHNFGNVLQGEVVSYSFHFTNTGGAPLLISNVSTSCGCTVGDFSREPIMPGKDGYVKATYDSKGHRGFQNRTLTVITNTNPNQTKLHLKANVKTSDQY